MVRREDATAQQRRLWDEAEAALAWWEERAVRAAGLLEGRRA